MRLEIRRKGVRLAASTRQYLTEHLSSALGKFMERIRLVTIHLADSNGPRGGVDKQCLISVQLAGGKVIRAGHSDTQLMAAIGLATDRVSYAVGCALKRRRRRSVRARPWESEPAA